MATRAATFSAKIHTLSDYYFRTRHGILPLPSGIDMANTLKYFSQTLLGVLKDVPSIPVEMMRTREQDPARLGLFPILDYKALHHVVVQLVDIVPHIQHGVHVLGQSLLHTIVCLVPFLEHEYIDALPNLVASAMTIFPDSLHQEILDALCCHLLPFTISSQSFENRNYATLSTSSIIMTVFQYSRNPGHHCQLLECLMSLKVDVVKDILCIIAHGTAVARAPATTLLFHYWPSLNPTLYDRRGIQGALPPWKAAGCERENCLSGENNEAIKICLDPAIAVGTGDNPPPLYVCHGCSEQIRQESADSCHLLDVLLPMQQVSATCENKNCRAADRSAVCTCFSMECASYNGNRPTRYCAQCHSIRHNNRRGGDHVVHVAVESPWTADPEMHAYTVEAIVSLLKEAQPIADKNYKESVEQHIRVGLLDADEQVDSNVLEERRMLSRYGIYLLVGLCTPTEDTSVEALGRLLAMLFQWFDATAYLKDDQAGSLLERLKSENVYNWLMEVCKSHFEVFVSALLPHPPEYARVGGHWDTVTSRTGHIKEGFNRLFCLVPYEIINLEVWNYIMPSWMHSIRTEVPESELPELKMLLSKVLDPEMSPLGFDAHSMYNFFSIRFHKTTARVQEQALQWLQILCELDIVVPLSLVYSMFNDGINSIRQFSGEGGATASPGHTPLVKTVIANEEANEVIRPTSPDSSDEQVPEKETEYKFDAEVNLPCFVLMLDVLLKQMELQEVTPHQGLDHIVSQETLSTLKEMIVAPWSGTHSCAEEDSFECVYCETCTTFYQLALDALDYVVPPLPESLDLSKMADPEMIADDGRGKSSQDDALQSSKSETCGGFGGGGGGVGGGGAATDPPAGISMKDLETRLMLEKQREAAAAAAAESMSSPPPLLFTATVQTVAETELQTVSIIPTEEVVKAVAHAVTLSETDVGSAKVSVVQATVVDENEQPLGGGPAAEDEGSFWQTTQGKFKFTLDELPISLRLIHLLLTQEIDKHAEADIRYHILSCLKILCFRCECLLKAAREHRGYLIWCQENLLIINLWNQLQVEYCNVAQIGVQLLLHCLALPSGSDTFWKIVEDSFHDASWKVRYAAVEKVTLIGRFLDAAMVRSCSSGSSGSSSGSSSCIQTSLANAFSYLVSSLDDASPHVAQRATLFLDTVQTSSLRALCFCLETQFDVAVADRPLVLQTLHQLYNCLGTERHAAAAAVLGWDFFLGRFDALFLEAQVALEKSGDIAYPRDLRNTDSQSEVFVQKLNRAHEALNQSSVVGGPNSNNFRSLSTSLGTKLRYKRALSAPSGMVSGSAKQEKIVDKEKLFSRQSSAPVLKRKSSKFGVAHLHHPLVAHFPNHMFPDGHLRESHDEQNFLSMFHKLMEMDDRDQDTLHLLVFLLMQFLAQQEHAYPTDEKAVAKTQNIVLRHLNLLLGYSPSEKGFCIPPAKMRVSPVFNAFLSNLSRVLDRNFKMANILLPICVPVLLYCPAPFRSSAEAPHLAYSLWCLEPRSRHAWLQSVAVLVYKYRYNVPPLAKQVLSLARIVLNTLTFHSHRCRGLLNSNLGNIASAPQSRGELCNIQERDTPPYSPRSTMEGVIVTITAPVEGKVLYQKVTQAAAAAPVAQDDVQGVTESEHWKYRKMSDFPSDVDDVEPELEAIPESIPESPKSESPQGDSLQDSIEELENVDGPFAEKAKVRIESGVAYAEEGLVVISPPLEMASKATAVNVQSGTGGGVERRMVQQIQEFNQSFDKDVVKRQRTLTTEDSLASDDSDDIRQMTIQADSVFIAKLEPYGRDVPEARSPPSGQDPRSKTKSYSLDETCPVVNHSKAGATGATGTNGASRCLEVLDASRLENATLRRAGPAVVSQTGKRVPPYLFQPIQSHPITVEKTVQSHQSVQSHGTGQSHQTIQQSPVSPKPAYNPNVPWSIQIHSPIKLDAALPAMPSPERLLPVGPMSQSDKSRSYDSPKMTASCQSGSRASLLDHSRDSVSGSKAASSATAAAERQPLLDHSQCDPREPSNGSLLTKVWQAFDGMKPSVANHKEDPGRLVSVVVDDGDGELHVATATTVRVCGGDTPGLVQAGAVAVRQPVVMVMKDEPGIAVRQPVAVAVKDAGWQPASVAMKDPGRQPVATAMKVQPVSVAMKDQPIATMMKDTLRHPNAVATEMKDDQSRAAREHHGQEAASPLLVVAPHAEPIKASLSCLSRGPAVTHSENKLTSALLPHWSGVGGGDVLKDSISAGVVACMSAGNAGAADLAAAAEDESGLRRSATVGPLESSSSSSSKGLQRLYPSFRQATEPQTKLVPSPCPSPRQLTKAFDAHLDLLYQSNLTGLEGGESLQLDQEPSPHHFLEKHSRRHEHDENRVKGHFRQRRQRKATIDPQKMADTRNTGNRKSRKGDLGGGGGGPGSRSGGAQAGQKGGAAAAADEAMVDRCPDCGSALEHYSEEELGLCIVILATCIHREPTAIASLLPEILHTVARVASNVMYPWETENNMYVPGNVRSVARQFLRCVLHQLAPSGVFIQIFQSSIDEPEFFKTMALALTDFNELNPTAPLQLLLEGLNEKKVLPSESIVRVLTNMASYMDSLQLEISASVWASILPQFEAFFRKLALVLPSDVDMTPTLRIFCNILHVQGLNSFKTILDPFSKIVSFALQHCSFKYQILLDLCHLCNRAFSKERDKLYMSRTVVFELVQALKFKTNIPDENLLRLVQFIIQDAGGTLGPSIILEDLGATTWDVQNMINTSSSECMRQYFAEALDFVADVHTLSKIKSNFKGTLVGLNEDTLGGTLKAGIAQYLALEITRGNNRENRATNRYLPWLYNPLPAVQQGPKEFIDCVTHIRLLSWLLLGSLIHMMVVGNNSNLVCQPIPLEASAHVADHVQVILAGFAEQSKASVLHMSSLFHAFILCQLWTMYCEQLTSLNQPGSESYHSASLTVVDFWAKVTPGILQLLSHSKVLAEMVTLHFLSLIEALIECNSTVLAKLFAMWRPVLHSYQNQLPGHLVVRLQACEDRPPPTQTKEESASTTPPLLKWVQRLQFKMGQIELQSSAATQFYSV